MLSQITKIALPKAANSLSLTSLQQLERVSLKSLVSLEIISKKYLNKNSNKKKIINKYIVS